MIFIVLYILFLLSGSYFISIYFDKDIEETIPVWVLSVTLATYIFGILGALKAGFYVSVILGIILSVFAVFLSFKKGISFKKFFTPGLLFFILVIMIAYRGNYGRMFIKTDEFSHWGLTIKNMFLSDSYWGSVQSNLIFKDYPPIVATFQYITLNIFGEYSEGIVFIAMNTLYYSLYVTLFSKTTYKQPIRILGLIATIILVPTIFFAGFYINLQVDAMMGLVFAYALITYYTKGDNMFSAISISLALSFLVLMKGAGIGLSIFALIIILVDRFAVEGKEKIFKNVRDSVGKLKVVIIPFISSLLFYTTWKVYLRISNINSTWSIDKNDASLIGKILNREQNTIITIKNFIEYHFNGHGDTLPGKVSFFAWICIIILVSIVMINASAATKDKKRLSGLVVTMTICCYAYLGSILITYITSFSEYESVRLASIDRYSYTFILGWLALTIGLVFSKNTFIKEQYRMVMSKVLVLLILIFISITPILNLTVFSADCKNKIDSHRDKFTQFDYVLDFVEEDVNKLDVIHCETKGYEGLVYNYMATPTRLHSRSIGLKPYYEGDSWTKIMTPEDYADYLLEYNFKYVYISYANDKFNENYGDLFSDGYAQNGRLYSVHEVDSDIGVLLEIIK